MTSAPKRRSTLPPREEIVLVVAGPTHSDVAALRDRLPTLVAGREPPLVGFDVAALTDADLETVDALARLQLAARRRGTRVRLLGASRHLRELLELVGLWEAFRLDEATGRVDRAGRTAGRTSPSPGRT